MEADLTAIPGLRFTVVRPAIVYGIGDKTGLGKFSFKFYISIIIVVYPNCTFTQPIVLTVN